MALNVTRVLEQKSGSSSPGRLGRVMGKSRERRLNRHGHIGKDGEWA